MDNDIDLVNYSVKDFDFDMNIKGLPPYKLIAYKHYLVTDSIVYEHSHWHTEIFICLKGSGYFASYSNKTEMNPGDIFIANPGIAHSENVNSPKSPMELLILCIDGISLNFSDTISENVENTKKNSTELQVFHAPEFVKNLQHYINLIETELSPKKRHFFETLKGIMDSLILLCLNHLGITYQITAPLPIKNKSVMPMLAIKEYIDNNYTAPLTLADLEKKFLINKFTIISSFKKLVGMTPMQYHLKLRLDRAKGWLKYFDYSLEVIASKLGFPNSSYLSTIFKRHVGMTPSQFKSTAWQKEK